MLLYQTALGQVLIEKKLGFDEKQRIFFNRYHITINPKTKKWNKEFYIDQNQNFQLGRLPPLQMTLTDGRKISLCKFCLSPLPETEGKGHDRRFCNSKCQQEYFQIGKMLKKLQTEDENVTGIVRHPKKENPDVLLSKTLPIQRHEMEITYKNLTKKPLTTKKGKRKELR